MTTEGLSPRVRGNQPGIGCAAGGPGSIPACAGEPAEKLCYASLHEVYPRVCGGTRSGLKCSPLNHGLSPRVRGNHGQNKRIGISVGSIPACAGEPSAPSSPSPTGAVYPRVCGGTSFFLIVLSKVGGLSPRVRGNQSLSAPH